MLPEFALERWLRAQEKKARYPIGGSGVARGDIAPYLGDPERAWATHPDDAGRMLRESVARQWELDPRHVLPTAGASEADAATALGLAGPGAHVVIERPAYHALLQPALAFGCRVERVQRDADDGWRLDPAKVIAAIRPGTKLVALARPNNPSGAVVPAAALREIADAAASVGAWVLVDEVFADATELGPAAATLHPRILSVNSVTKCLGFSGLRAGWVAGAPDALEAIDRAKALLSVQNALVDLQIASRVVDDRPKILQRTRALRAANAVLVARELDTRVGDHGTTTLVRLPAGVADVAFAERLAAERGVVTPPGAYIEAPGHVRVGLVGPTETLRAGLAELRAALRAA